METTNSEAPELTEAALDEIEARANAATDGPWEVNDPAYPEYLTNQDGVTPVAGGRWGGEANLFETSEDAYFIAAARQDVPALVAEVRRLRSELAAARGGA